MAHRSVRSASRPPRDEGLYARAEQQASCRATVLAWIAHAAAPAAGGAARRTWAGGTRARAELFQRLVDTGLRNERAPHVRGL